MQQLWVVLRAAGAQRVSNTLLDSESGVRVTKTKGDCLVPITLLVATPQLIQYCAGTGGMQEGPTGDTDFLAEQADLPVQDDVPLCPIATCMSQC